MHHPLESLTRATPGIVEVWVSDLIVDEEDTQSGRLLRGNLQNIGAISDKELNGYDVPIAVLTGYVLGLFEVYEAGRYQSLDLVYLRNQGDNVIAVFDCRRFLKLAPVDA